MRGFYTALKEDMALEKNLKVQEPLLASYQSYRDDKVLERMRPVYQNLIGRSWEKEARARETARRKGLLAERCAARSLGN